MGVSGIRERVRGVRTQAQTGRSFMRHSHYITLQATRSTAVPVFPACPSVDPRGTNSGMALRSNKKLSRGTQGLQRAVEQRQQIQGSGDTMLTSAFSLQAESTWAKFQLDPS